MSNFSDFFGGGVKSVQRGVATPTSAGELSVTVTAVNPARSVLNLLSSSSYTDSYLSTTNTVSLRLVNSTTIGVTSQTLLPSTDQQYLLPCSWELIEFA